MEDGKLTKLIFYVEILFLKKVANLMDFLKEILNGLRFRALLRTHMVRSPLAGHHCSHLVLSLLGKAGVSVL